MEITKTSKLKSEKLNIVVGNISFELVIVNLSNGNYLIADGYASDSEYSLVSVPNLEKDTVKPELEDFLFSNNIALGDITSEEIDEIAEAIEKIDI